MSTVIRESHYRSILKGITWRAVGTLDTIVIAYIITGQGITAISIGGIEVFTKIVLYYLHERAWQLVPRGRVRRWFQATNRHPEE
jgi:uncharacterized membrane protein